MKKIILLIIILTISFALRIYRLGSNPPSLYWDEASLGYNAYSIATSLYDEHGEFLPLGRFMAFGDYKPPGYIYAAVPSVLLFGLNEFSVRIPSFMAGILMVLFTYLLVKELFGSEKLALLAGLLLGISPWSIQFSRAAFEAHLAALFNLVAIYLFILSRRKKWTLVLSVIFFILSFYTFNANRIISPLILSALSIIYFRDLFRSRKWLIITFITAIILIIPSISFLKSDESRLRFQEVSIFNNLEVIRLSNQRIDLDRNSVISRIFHNRRILFGIDFLKHYFDNFSGRFLFTHGDVNPRLSVQDMGELYIWDLIFLICGVYMLIKRRDKTLAVLFVWMVIAPIPAGAARETPHALRIISILPVYQIIIAYGIYQLIINLKKSILNSSTSGESLYSSHPRGVLAAYCFVLFSLSFLLSVNIYYYMHNYYAHYPQNWSGEWQFGYKQMVESVERVRNNYDHVFVTEALGRPYIFFAFYGEYSRNYFRENREASRDGYGFWNVSRLGNIRFGLDGLSQTRGRILLVTASDNLSVDFRLLETVGDLSGKDVFRIGERI